MLSVGLEFQYAIISRYEGRNQSDKFAEPRYAFATFPAPVGLEEIETNFDVFEYPEPIVAVSFA